MLPVYHRPYDTKLLLLSIPACAMLWAEGGLIRWLALLVNTAAVVLTGDIPLIALRLLTKDFNISAAGLPGKIVTVAVTRPIPPILLTMGIFYLWVYVRRMRTPAGFTDVRSPEQQPHEPEPLASSARQERGLSNRFQSLHAIPDGERG